jgi:hypothetical protein
VGEFLVFTETSIEAQIMDSEENGSSRIWEEKDVADLLGDLKYFDEKQK